MFWSTGSGGEGINSNQQLRDLREDAVRTGGVSEGKSLKTDLDQPSTSNFHVETPDGFWNIPSVRWCRVAFSGFWMRVWSTHHGEKKSGLKGAVGWGGKRCFAGVMVDVQGQHIFIHLKHICIYMWYIHMQFPRLMNTETFVFVLCV